MTITLSITTEDPKAQYNPQNSYTEKIEAQTLSEVEAAVEAKADEIKAKFPTHRVMVTSKTYFEAVRRVQ